MGRLLLVLFLYLVIGAPLVLFSWHEISEALLGRFQPTRFLAVLAIIPVLLWLLSRLGHYLNGLEGGAARAETGSAGGPAEKEPAGLRLDTNHPVSGGEHVRRTA